VLAGGQRVGVLIAEDPPPVRGTQQPDVLVQQAAVQSLGLDVTTLQADRGGQVVPGGNGVQVILALDPDPVGKQVPVQILALTAAAAPDLGTGQAAACGQRGRVITAQAG